VLKNSFRLSQAAVRVLAPLVGLLSLPAQASSVSPVTFDALMRDSASHEIVVVAPRYSEQALSAQSDAITLCQLLGFRAPREPESAIESRPPRGGAESALVVGRSGRPESIEPRAQRLIRSLECRET
jgi:hypothetical protein